MAKTQKESIYLVSSEGTGFFYTFRKNKKKSKAGGKLARRKYDPIAKKHVLFEEKKLSALKKKYDPEKAAAEVKGKGGGKAKKEGKPKKAA